MSLHYLVKYKFPKTTIITIDTYAKKYAMVVRFSYMWFMESATVSLIRQILLLTLDVQKPKSFQLQGGFAPPDPMTRGSAPGPRWGPPPDSRYRLALPRSP